jgi:hypothetical protein
LLAYPGIVVVAGTPEFPMSTMRRTHIIEPLSRHAPVRAEEKKAAVLAILADQLPDQAKLVSL